METITLPKSKAELSKAIDAARKAAWTQRNHYLLVCQLMYYYLRGFRRFKIPDVFGTQVMVGYETDLGELRLRYEDLRRKYVTEMGRWLKMDLGPTVMKTGWGLDSVRKSSMGQVTLDFCLRHVNLDTVKMELFEHMLTFGTVGIGHWRTMLPDGTMVPQIEVISPWEMMPIPAVPTSGEDVRGHMRFRYVPLKWLQAKAGKDLEDEGLDIPTGSNISDATRNKLQIMEVPYGHSPEGYWAGMLDDADGFSVSSALAEEAEDRATPDSHREKLLEKHVPLTETWTLGPNYTVDRYIIQAGRLIIKDMNFREKSAVVPCPVDMIRQVPDMGYYSYGMVGMLMSGNHQLEKMLQNLYRNVEEMDQYGTVMWPLTAGAGKSEFTKKNGRPKLVTFEPDYTVPEQKPFTLTPANTGDFPGRVAMMGSQFQDKIAGQGPMFSGQPLGRMDSASGVGLSFEIQQISQAATAHQIANAFSRIYRSILESAKETIETGNILTLTNVTDDVAGIVLAKDGSVSLDKNPLPHFWEVMIDVKDRQPKSKELREQKLMQMFQLQLIDQVEFVIRVFREGLELPVGSRAMYEAYRKAMFNNIVLFNDGTKPGQIRPSQVFDNPEVHLRAVREFTSRLEFSFASPSIKRGFKNWIMLLEGQLAGYPAGVPDLTSMEPGPQGSLMPPGQPMGGGGEMPMGAGEGPMPTPAQAGPATGGMGM